MKCDFTDFIMPVEIEKVPKRASIVKRNQWVWIIQIVSFVIFAIKSVVPIGPFNTPKNTKRKSSI